MLSTRLCARYATIGTVRIDQVGQPRFRQYRIDPQIDSVSSALKAELREFRTMGENIFFSNRSATNDLEDSLEIFSLSVLTID